VTNGALTTPLTVGVLVERRYRCQAQPAGLCAELERHGHRTHLIDPEEICRVGATGWLKDVDVVVPRGRSAGLLALVKHAEQRGVPVVNGGGAIRSVHNKLDMAVALIADGIPTPDTFAAPLPRLAEEIPPDDYPLVLKPLFGDNGHGLALAWDAEELARIDWPEPIAFAQRFVSNGGWDLKLYGIGGDVWAVCKPSPFIAPAAYARRPAAVELTPELITLARRCGDLFGLELYGVDCIETADGPLVIEVNEFPNYTAVSEADERLVAQVERRAAR
jgi:ribosomal protein S6--L-glutamate ligase